MDRLVLIWKIYHIRYHISFLVSFANNHSLSLARTDWVTDASHDVGNIFRSEFKHPSNVRITWRMLSYSSFLYWCMNWFHVLHVLHCVATTSSTFVFILVVWMWVNVFACGPHTTTSICCTNFSCCSVRIQRRIRSPTFLCCSYALRRSFSNCLRVATQHLFRWEMFQYIDRHNNINTQQPNGVQCLYACMWERWESSLLLCLKSSKLNSTCIINIIN